MDEQRLASPPQQPERLGGSAWNPESVKWVEDQALLVSAFQERVIDALEKQAASLLNLLLAGAGGARMSSMSAARSFFSQPGMAPPLAGACARWR